MRIENAHIFTETAQFVKRNITIGGQYIIDGTPEDEIIDASNLYVIPGLIDTHVHGALGEDFSSISSDGLSKILKYQVQNGVTSLCPTILSDTKENMLQNCRIISEYQAADDESDIVGIHLEGPFLSEEMKGAQQSEYFSTPDIKLVENFTSLSDELVYILTLAPELQGSTEIISKLENFDSQLIISLGHTAADYSNALHAFKAGASRTTHLFNAMPPLTHLEPGVVGAAFDSEDSFVEIVANGMHIHPSLVRGSISMFGEDRALFVSDSFSGTGMPNGRYPFGESEFEVKNETATLVSDPEVIGSTRNLMDCLKAAVNDMDISLETAVRLASMNPAISLDLFDQLGSVTPGKYADLVIIDEEVNIKAVVIKGEMVLNLL